MRRTTFDNSVSPIDWLSKLTAIEITAIRHEAKLKINHNRASPFSAFDFDWEPIQAPSISDGATTHLVILLRTEFLKLEEMIVHASFVWILDGESKYDGLKDSTCLTFPPIGKPWISSDSPMNISASPALAICWVLCKFAANVKCCRTATQHRCKVPVTKSTIV